jgi:hypothetical protein
MKNILIVLLLTLSAVNGFGQKRFEAKKLGFSIAVPKDWIAVENSDIVKNLNNYDFTQEQLDELLKSNNASVNLATFTKYDSKKVSGIIPTVKIRTNKNQTKSTADFLKFVESSSESAKKSLTNFRFIDNPSIIKISNSDVIKFSAQFSLKNGAIDYEIISNSYYIPKNGYYISVNFIEQVGKEDNSLLFDELVKSMILTN